MNLKQELYRITDRFLTEAKNQNGEDRSLERLNADRHLAVEEFIKIITKLLEELRYEELKRDFKTTSEDRWSAIGYNACAKSINSKINKIINNATPVTTATPAPTATPVTTATPAPTATTVTTATPG